METLSKIWQRLKEQGHETDKGSVHSYIPVYEQLFEQYRETALNVLEIGLFNGASIRMWCEYFTKATIHGVDCSLFPHDGMADLRPLLKDNIPNARIYFFDAENESKANSRFKDIKFDVIIDDAGHDINQQLNLFRIWKEYLVKDGVYVIEDIQDIDRDEHLFIANGITIIDYRKRKGRYDDVLAIIRNKYL